MKYEYRNPTFPAFPGVGEPEEEKYSEAALKKIRKTAAQNDKDGEEIWRDRCFAQMRVGTCSTLRGYFGHSREMSRVCLHCNGAEEDASHYWERCPEWGEQRLLRGDVDMVGAPGAALRYMRDTKFGDYDINKFRQ